MSEQNSIFRDEALQFRARGRQTPGGVIRLGPAWLRSSYWLLVALVLAGAIVAVVIHARETTTGPAVVDGRESTFAALLPAATAVDLPSARAVYVDVPSGRLSINVLRARPVDPDGIKHDGLPAASQPSILLSGRVKAQSAKRRRPLRASSHTGGTITVVLRTRTVGAILVSQFEDMLGYGRGGR